MLSRFGVCVSLKEHMQSTSGESERTFWLEKKRLLIEQQWYVINITCVKERNSFKQYSVQFLGQNKILTCFIKFKHFIPFQVFLPIPFQVLSCSCG